MSELNMSPLLGTLRLARVCNRKEEGPSLPPMQTLHLPWATMSAVHGYGVSLGDSGAEGLMVLFWSLSG